ncbi:A disintegrin and metalloproteinase with thrombospondin motifs 18 [Fopius arisanus]|uniref:A disintegrin and metalloproteinase with thrombospondin motifs 18 n=1 Tax=Fopius arisanus TaxID=64838 RepID=A0A0C9QT06_9HYME|nr:PREDICTED: A disintegrin and metalloproteinase with thrombospondin motifs 18 [Fopius arisanus]
MTAFLRAAGLILIGWLSFGSGSHREDVDIVFIERRNSRTSEIPLHFTAFNQKFELKLRRNDRLLAPYFQVWRHEGSNKIQEIPGLSNPPPCYYLHQDNRSSAALSLCKDVIEGVILLNNLALEISPLEEMGHNYRNRTSTRERVPHLVKRSHIAPPEYLESNRNIAVLPLDSIPRSKRGSSQELTIELAVFFDDPGYKLFAPFFNSDEGKMRDMLLAYVNAIQALFYHPSLGSRVTIALVRLDLMKKQPSTLPHHDGQRERLLDSFCNYTSAINPENDAHPNHWDIGLYVSGLDFYAEEKGQRNGVTMGLATVSGTCYHQYSCVIAELGATNRLGKPYPSAGFTSVYIAAHEIGHNLGMHHDSTGNPCPRDGYIMSPSRGSTGETIWSTCSRQVVQELPQTKPCLMDKSSLRADKFLEHERFNTLPGREWTAKRQCELLLRDKDASVVTLANACQSLQCRSPHRSGYYYSGPALEGTFCTEGMECRGGECVPALYFPSEKPRKPKPMGENIWSKWIEGKCTSGCISKSKGARSKKRTCREDSRVCEGLAFAVDLCQDSKLCTKRLTAEDFATIKCREFSDRIQELDPGARGLQAPHEVDRPWMACAIFCKRRDIASYYTPRVELNDLEIDPYFPDGTWCHSEKGRDYFCLQHHCLPENFRFQKNSPVDPWDFDIGPQNARPGGNFVSQEMRDYFSINDDGTPLLKILPERDFGGDEWVDQDYRELPGEM